MILNQNNKLDELSAAFGNKFAAICYIARLARELSADCEYYISDSQALTWAITGVKPPKVVIKSKDLSTVRSPVSYVLDLVDDIEVKSAVLASLRCTVFVYLSKDMNTFYTDEDVPEYSKGFISKLILNSNPELHWVRFNYRMISDEQRRARVRILTKLIWDNFEY